MKCLLDIQWEILCLINESNLTREIRDGDRNLGVIGIEILFKTIGQNEIILGESVDNELTKTQKLHRSAPTFLAQMEKELTKETERLLLKKMGNPQRHRGQEKKVLPQGESVHLY